MPKNLAGSHALLQKLIIEYVSCMVYYKREEMLYLIVEFTYDLHHEENVSTPRL